MQTSLQLHATRNVCGSRLKELPSSLRISPFEIVATWGSGSALDQNNTSVMHANIYLPRSRQEPLRAHRGPHSSSNTVPPIR